MLTRGLAMSARRFCTLGVLFALFATCFFASAAQADVLTGDPLAPAAETQAAPTIASDKADYAPGESVVLTGGGWQPGESVHVVVNDDGMNPEQPWVRDVTVVADETGGIVDQFNRPTWFVATYSVQASGASGTAAATFTDANTTASRPTTTADPSTYGDSVTFTTAISASGGTPAPTTGQGTVTFFDEGVAISSCTNVALSASSQATCTVSNLPVGNRKITARFFTSVPATYADSGISQALTQNVNPKALTVSGVTAPNKVYDRTTSASVNFASAALTGVIAGDTVTL